MGVGNTIRVCFRGLGSERVKEIRKQLGNGDAVSQIFIRSFLGLYRRCCFTSFSVSVSVCVSSRVYVRVSVCVLLDRQLAFSPESHTSFSFLY
ncbi:hypothetical protein DPX39_090022700 [Trypanosoma brucei equiperdum]|uniref:Uncharacterized protein n=1 Tax=Trypanosoma brucei equiperdum TaxID=630700 RepID=A0A3L6L1P8_9TRYP|nr:hypothetical protein DPX39_090022700 [Trypanosoma brucei equiperdum]